jgi:hypothetical protein
MQRSRQKWDAKADVDLDILRCGRDTEQQHNADGYSHPKVYTRVWHVSSPPFVSGTPSFIRGMVRSRARRPTRQRDVPPPSRSP